MGLSFDASIFHPQLPEVVSLARAHPDASIVVIHTASPLGFGSYAGKEKQVHADWLAGMKELARCPNVTVKMGGLLMCLGNFDFSKAEAPPTSEQLADALAALHRATASRCSGPTAAWSRPTSRWRRPA